MDRKDVEPGPRVGFHSACKGIRANAERSAVKEKYNKLKQGVASTHKSLAACLTPGDPAFLYKRQEPFCYFSGSLSGSLTLCYCIPTSRFSSILLVSGPSLQEIEFCTMKGITWISTQGWSQKANLQESLA